MLKKITNVEIIGMAEIFSNNESFIFTMRLPAPIRHSIRSNQSVVFDKYNAYDEERKDIIKTFVRENKAKQDGDKISIDPKYKDEFISEMNELASLTNELNLEAIDAEVLDNFLDNHDLTLSEENLLMIFKEEQ